MSRSKPVSPGFPDEILLFVTVEVSAGPDTPMTLWSMRDASTGARLTPAFSTMEAASRFLADALKTHRLVALDYIFRCEWRRLQSDFPDLEAVLDPTAAEFFARADPASA